ncbi:SET domain-containing protein [Heliocybe sulcata]|uniref:SET domain-containing protein n=1 Tax=Heliocybe sulcata TaxID=5364 RepID=A0A5C3N1S9_9AGAM|nr:SET domain-containing protein [Heliocybe sulcata]
MGSVYEIKPTSYGGRGAFATSSIPAGTVVHTSPSPFAHVVYRVFRKEVCAWCWRYAWDDGGKRNWSVKVNCGGKGKERDRARGGLWFCGEECKEEWMKDDEDGLAMEVYEAIDREGAKAMKFKPPADSKPSNSKQDVLSIEEFVPDNLQAEDLTQELLDDIWAKVETTARLYFGEPPSSGKSRGKRKMPIVPLGDEHDIDLARFVASGLISVHRDNHRAPCTSPPSSVATTPPRSPTPSSIESASEPDESSSLPLVSTAEASGSPSASWPGFLSLQPNELSALRSSPNQLSQWIQVYLFLASIFVGHPLHPLILDPSYTCAIFNRDAGNSFGIWQLPYMDESEMFGWGVWVDASYFNHSCSPNLVKKRSGRVFSFLTTRPIEAGEELCISYGNVNDDVITRRKRLWDGWWFWCGCTRCAEDCARSAQGSA